MSLSPRESLSPPVPVTGQRLLEGVARMTMDRFYGCLQKHVAQG